MPNITVSENVKHCLETLKEIEGHTSLDSVIREVIQDSHMYYGLLVERMYGMNMLLKDSKYDIPNRDTRIQVNLKYAGECEEKRMTRLIDRFQAG